MFKLINTIGFYLFIFFWSDAQHKSISLIRLETAHWLVKNGGEKQGVCIMKFVQNHCDIAKKKNTVCKNQ